MDALSKHSLEAFRSKQRAKDTKKRPYETKKQFVFQSFTGIEKTMLEVEKLTGVKRTNICPFTKHPAKFLSTNPNNYNDLLK